jgi:uncharacterized protein (TIGR02646 family)
MLKINEAATIPADVQTELDAIPAAERKDQWPRATNAIKAFKRAVKQHGMAVQNAKCVWCESKVGFSGRRSAHRDHIAPKDLYSAWTFEPYNLALSCEYCNGFEVKKDLDTIAVLASTYADSQFHIVHPYFDNPEEHISFVHEEARIVMKSLSPKGIWTIDKMRLDSPSATANRALEAALKDIALPPHLVALIEQAMEGL